MNIGANGENPIIEIEEFLLKITGTEEYLSVEYLIFSIRKLYLNFMTALRLKNFEVPHYLEKLVKCVDREFEASGILADDILKYMLENDMNNWVHYYTDAFLIPISNVASGKKVQCDRQLFILVLTAYILDNFRNKSVDIRQITADEKINYATNQHKLSIVNGVIFHRDYFVFDNKAYLYNRLTDTSVINFTDEMPGFAKIITEQICTGDILLRLDERLALPVKEAISYSTLGLVLKMEIAAIWMNAKKEISSLS